MIEKRAKSFVTSNGLVPIDAICNKIGQGKNIESLTAIYPKLNVEDIFEAVHFYADNTSVPTTDPENLLTVQNTGSHDNIVIEVTNLHQIVYIKLLAIAHDMYPELLDFAKLMNQGLRICTLRNVEMFENNQQITDEMCIVVNDAMQMAVPDIVNDWVMTKEDLDYNEYKERQDRNET